MYYCIYMLDLLNHMISKGINADASSSIDSALNFKCFCSTAKMDFYIS